MPVFDILILNYMTCLTLVKRYENYREIREEVLESKKGNKLLEANIKMIDFKLNYQETLEKYKESIYDFDNDGPYNKVIQECQEVCIAFQEARCLEGEILCLYVMASFEQYFINKARNRLQRYC